MVVSYKCPQCGAPMEFDPETGKLSCAYCGLITTIEALEADPQENVQFETVTEKPETVQNENGTFRVYRCPSCGAEMLTDSVTSATVCAFCGTPGLIQDQLTGEKRPTKIIPFALTRQQAVEEFRDWSKGVFLTPRNFTQASTLEKITGVYVPYWLHDYRTQIRLDAHCTRTNVVRHGDEETTYTQHFNVVRDMDVDYSRIPTDASEKMDDATMDLLEPYDYSDLKTFDMPYLSGYLAERFTYTAEEMEGRARNRARSFAEQTARGTISGYGSVSIVNQQINFRKTNEEYVLLPVWMLNYRFKDQNYLLAINGQTGKRVGTLPVDKGRANGVFIGLFAGLFVLLTLLGGLL